jgi:general secretion pathway protein I
LSGRRQLGFTLIEVLVALVIVAVGMSVLMGALSSSARSVVYMQDKTFAEWVALNQIALLRIGLQKGQVPPAGTTNGDLEFGNRSWHWRQDVVASQVPGINLINFKVRPKEIKGGDDDSWYVTVTGLAGNGMAAAGTSTALVNWDPDLNGGGQPGTGAGNGGTGLNPPASKTPTPAPTPTPGINQ